MGDLAMRPLRSLLILGAAAAGMVGFGSATPAQANNLFASGLSAAGTALDALGLSRPQVPLPRAEEGAGTATPCFRVSPH